MIRPMPLRYSAVVVVRGDIGVASMRECPHGEYVHWPMYEALHARVEKLEAALWAALAHIETNGGGSRLRDQIADALENK